MKPYPLLFLSLIVLSCQSKEDKKQVTLSFQKQVEIPIDFVTKPETRALQYLDSGEHGYLAYLNEFRNQLLIINLSESSIEKRINWIDEGPEAVNNVFGFQLVNDSTIIATSQGKRELSLTSLEGKLMKRYPFYTDSLQESSTFYVRSTINTPVIVWDSSYLIHQFIPGSIEHTKNLDGLRMFLQVDTQTGKSHFPPFFYPKGLWEDGKTEPHFAYQQVGDSVYVLFQQHDRIYRYDKEGNYTSKKVRSQYFESFEPLPEFESIEELEKYHCETPSFRNLLYDPFREYFYIIAYPGVEVDNQTDIMNLSKYKPLFSVIILDKNLNHLGEVMMPHNKYLMKNIFVGREGLYLSENIPSNPDFDENFLRFSVFRPVQRDN